MWKARLDEAQAGIKIARRNINNLRYADTTLTAEKEEGLKSLLMKVKEEWKSWLKTQQSKKIMASGSISSWQTEEETMETVTDFLFLGFKIITDGDCSHLKMLAPWDKSMTNLNSILKSRDIILQTKACQSYGFSSSNVWMWVGL